MCTHKQYVELTQNRSLFVVGASKCLYVCEQTCVCVCLIDWLFSCSKHISWDSSTELAYKSYSTLHEALQTASSFKDCHYAFVLFTRLHCRLAAPDYLHLRRRFRWDRRPEFNGHILSQVKSLKWGGPPTVWLRFCRKVRKTVNKNRHRNRKGWKEWMLETDKRLCRIGRRKATLNPDCRPAINEFIQYIHTYGLYYRTTMTTISHSTIHFYIF